MITNNDIKSLAHTKWNCKYHIVFAPKFRRKQVLNVGKQGGSDASLLAITSLSSHRSFNSNEVQSKT